MASRKRQEYAAEFKAKVVLESLQRDTLIEIDQITPRSRGKELSDTWGPHRHFHDQRHSRRVDSTSDIGYVIEEPCDRKRSCAVPKLSEGVTPPLRVTINRRPVSHDLLKASFISDVRERIRAYCWCGSIAPGLLKGSRW
jgi:hypothetical protein